MKKNKHKAAQEKIGSFIKHVREEKGMTQEDLARALGTSQSAVARIETGKQNMTVENLAKIGEVLDRKLFGLSEAIDFRITGGQRLKGSIRTNYSKNGAVNMIAASLVNRGKTILHGIPKIEEVYRYIEILEGLGVSVRWIDEHSIEIIPPYELNLKTINEKAMRQTRSFTFVGSLIHWENDFSFPHSGGCKMGERTIAAHKYSLEKFGVKIITKELNYQISYKKLKPAIVPLFESSDTGAINAIVAAAGLSGTSVIKFAPPNYQVRDVCFLLEKMGVRIDGIGTTTLTVHGQGRINKDIEHWNSEDPIESMFLMTAGIMTDSEITVTHCPIEFIELELEKLLHMGLKFKKSKEYISENQRTILVDITIYPSKLVALKDKLHTQPFPGLQNDNLPFFVPIAIKAHGTTLVHDWTWENRAIYFTEFNKLGASVRLADPHRAFVDGPSRLKGTQIVSPPALRPTAAIFLAMLGAEGTSVLRNVYSMSRGYADIAARLNKLGAKIEVLRGI
ncbi:MAG: helix-turn-helix domain-containing protein [Candidatus Paceibacterota bacterium]